MPIAANSDTMIIKLSVFFHSSIVDRAMCDVRHVYGQGISLITQQLISIDLIRNEIIVTILKTRWDVNTCPKAANTRTFNNFCSVLQTTFKKWASG